MPEGDSLHHVALRLAPALVGKPLRELRLVRRTDDTRGLAGRHVIGVEARGKNLLVHFEGGFSLHVHLKMNGRVAIYPRDDSRRLNESRVVVVLDTESHRVVCESAPVARLLRTSDLSKDLHLRTLGPDLLAPEFDVAAAAIRLSRCGETPLGEALMDQSVIAGIGNVWKSELCFTCRLDPFAAVSAHTAAELESLLVLAHRQMRDNVHGRKRTIPDPFSGSRHERKTRVGRRLGERAVSVSERAGERCYDCGAIIAVKKQGATHRSTYYCPVCQPSRVVA